MAIVSIDPIQNYRNAYNAAVKAQRAHDLAELQYRETQEANHRARLALEQAEAKMKQFIVNAAPTTQPE